MQNTNETEFSIHLNTISENKNYLRLEGISSEDHVSKSPEMKFAKQASEEVKMISPFNYTRTSMP